MADNDLLIYLKRYTREPQIITPQLRDLLPSVWDSLIDKKQADRISWVLTAWGEFKSEFLQVVNYLSNNLEAIDFVQTHRGVAMIYSVRAKTGSLMYYEGRPPVSKNPNQTTDSLWQQAPSALHKFYQSLHNGWQYFASESLGPMPLENMFVLNKQDWGILEQLKSVPVSLDLTLTFFSNGMGDYICQDYSGDTPNTLLWYHDRAPKTQLQFWPLIDSWTHIGFEG